MGKEPVNVPPEVYDPLDGVDHVFASGIAGMEVQDGVATLNFTRSVYPAPGSEIKSTYNRVVLKMAVPLPAFIRMAEWFENTNREVRERMAEPAEAQD